jgi:riboflavin kinase/FMN adenylyltransferase
VTNDPRPWLEVYVLEPTKLTYGDAVTVRWLHFLRPESRFGSVEAMREQIARDRENALEFFAKKAAASRPKDA